MSIEQYSILQKRLSQVTSKLTQSYVNIAQCGLFFHISPSQYNQLFYFSPRKSTGHTHVHSIHDTFFAGLDWAKRVPKQSNGSYVPWCNLILFTLQCSLSLKAHSIALMYSHMAIETYCHGTPIRTSTNWTRFA